MFGAQTQQQQQQLQPNALNPNNHYIVPQVQQGESISCIKWSNNATQGLDLLASGAWDGDIRIWQVDTAPQAMADPQRFNATPKMMYKHGAPVLSLAFSPDNRLFSAGCDNLIKEVQLTAGGSQQPNTIGKHDSPVKCIQYLENFNIVMSGGWDNSIKYWDLRQSNMQPAMQLSLPERVYCMDAKGMVAVAGLANKQVALIDLRRPNAIMREDQSPLKYQTRCISLFPDQQGYGIGSIEGRVGIQFFDDPNPNQKKSYQFKCHRGPTPQNNVYSINSICFHPEEGTFCTAGSDGKFHFWDKDAKLRLAQYPSGPNDKLSQMVVDTSFNRTGSIFAYVDSYDWSKGPSGFNKSAPNHIFLHNPGDNVKRKKR